MIELCNQLSQIRSLFFSHGFFFWTHKKTGEEIPLETQTRTTLGLRDGFSKAYKKDGSIKKNLSRLELSYGNPQTIDECILSPLTEFVSVRFSLQITAYSRELHSCSDPLVRTALKEFTSACAQHGIYNDLADRYLQNILMGRWLWLNQKTKSTEISITDLDDNCIYTITDVHKRRRTNDLSTFEEDYKKLANRFAKALMNDDDYWDLVIEARLKFRDFAEIFPSQVFSDGGKDRSRTYATYKHGDMNQVIFTSYKLAAAIHTIDDWFPGADMWLRVSAYGSDRQHSTAHRHPETGNDIYSLMKHADEFTKLFESGDQIPHETLNKIRYLVAMMVCGGLRQVGEE